MDTRTILSCSVLLAVAYLMSAKADMTTAPANLPESEVPAVQALDATPPSQVTAEVWNRSKGAIKVSQKGRLTETVVKGKPYQSRDYPEVPINIQVPGGTIQYITVTGKSGACTVPVCIFIQ